MVPEGINADMFSKSSKAISQNDTAGMLSIVARMKDLWKQTEGASQDPAMHAVYGRASCIAATNQTHNVRFNCIPADPDGIDAKEHMKV